MHKKVAATPNTLPKESPSQIIAKKALKATDNAAMDDVIGDNTPVRTSIYIQGGVKKYTYGPRVQGDITTNNVVSVFDEYAKLSGGKSLIADILEKAPSEKAKRIGQSRNALSAYAKRIGLEQEVKDFNLVVNSELNSTADNSAIIEAFQKLLATIHKKEKDPSLQSPKEQRRPTFYIMPENLGFVDIDGDGKKDFITHGSVVAMNVKRQCHAAIELTDTEAKPDVVISTFGASPTIKSIKKVTNLPLSYDNLAEFKTQIMQWFNIPNEKIDQAQFEKDYAKQAKAGIKLSMVNSAVEINNYRKQNIPVFVAAGNNSRSLELNAFLCDVTAVGALEANNDNKLEPADYSADTDLVTRWEQESYVRVIRGEDGTIQGYNVSNGHNIDIPATILSAKEKDVKTKWIQLSSSSAPIEIVKTLRGTSFTAPKAAGRLLRKIFGDACDLPVKEDENK